MGIVDRYWSAIRWDCQHLLHFSAYEYFQWVEVGRNHFQRRRPMEELLGFFDTLMNIAGSKTNEAVLEDPETIEWMASRKDDDSRKTPIFGQTETISLLKTLIDVQAGESVMPRAKIPGLELRQKRQFAQTKSSVAKAQERDRKRRERLAHK